MCQDLWVYWVRWELDQAVPVSGLSRSCCRGPIHHGQSVHPSVTSIQVMFPLTDAYVTGLLSIPIISSSSSCLLFKTCLQDVLLSIFFLPASYGIFKTVLKISLCLYWAGWVFGIGFLLLVVVDGWDSLYWVGAFDFFRLSCLLLLSWFSWLLQGGSVVCSCVSQSCDIIMWLWEIFSSI